MDVLGKSPLTQCMASFSWAAGTTNTLSTTGTNAFVIESIYYGRSALTNQATPTTDWATGNAFIPIPIPLTTTGLPPGVPGGCAGYACAYTLGMDHSGNIKVIQGPIVGLDANGNFISAAPSLSASVGPAGPNPGSIAGGVPADNDFCPTGFVVAKLGSTAVATWTFGTSNFSSVTGVTWSFGNIATLTGRPLAGLTYA